MANYFDKFPKTRYNISRSDSNINNYQVVTNIFVRLRVLSESISNIFNYYDYTIRENETPEILAEKYYNDPEAHWLILLTNNIVDPQYDWVLNTRDFDKYIITKYGSIATAQVTNHHYEKIIKRVNTTTDETSLDTYIISATEYATLPTEPGSPDATLTISGSVINTYPAYRNAVSAYDWEFSENEKRRRIKLIKPEYYAGIKNEFLAMMRNATPQTIIPGIRVLKK